MRLKKVYDKEKGIYVYINPQTGAGIFDTLFSAAAKATAKKAIETAGKAALESGSKKVGDIIGRKAVEKAVQLTSPKAVSKPRGNVIAEELEDNMNIRLNRLLSGGSIKYRINRLLK